MVTYQVANWDKHFENERSRSRKHCSFVCVPNKQHGMGFSRIMAEKDGSAIYGVWHLVLGACSQQENRNGWLTSDGEPTGIPWGVEDLSLKFRRPQSEISRALDLLSSPKVGWIVIHNSLTDSDKLQNPPSTPRLPPAHPPSAPLEEKRREEKRMEGKTASRPVHPSLEEVKLVIAKTGLPESDAIWFWNKCEANGWTNGGRPIKSWQHTIAAWKAAGYMPSQKNPVAQPKEDAVLRMFKAL